VQLSWTDGTGAGPDQLGGISDSPGNPRESGCRSHSRIRGRLGKDPVFYEFYRTMEYYRNFNNPKSFFVLSTEADIFKYLKNTGKAPGK